MKAISTKDKELLTFQKKLDKMKKLKEKWMLLCLDKVEALKRCYHHEKESAKIIDDLKRKVAPKGFWEKVKFLIKNE